MSVNDSEIQKKLEEQFISVSVLNPNQINNLEPKKIKEIPIIIKSISVAAQGVLYGIHLTANSKMLSMLSGDETGASSIVTTFQTVVIGMAGGFLYATGIELGDAMGKRDFIKAGNIAKTSWVVSLTFGGLSTIAMLTVPYIFPLLYSKQAANIASDFFKGYAAAGIPSMLILSSPQIAFQAGEWYVPFACGTIFYIPGAVISYVLAFQGKMGALGIGLGGSIAGWISTFAVQCWLGRKNYADYQLYNMRLDDFKKNLISFLKTGFQASLQRITEYINLLAITITIGLGNNSKYLASTPPSYPIYNPFRFRNAGVGTS